MKLRESLRTMLFFSLLVLLVIMNYFYFPSKLLGYNNYILFFLDQGPLITLSFSILSIIWKELNKIHNLVSTNPQYYLGACMIVIAGVFHTFGKASECLLRPALGYTSDRFILWELTDHLFAVIISFFMILICILWLLVVAPAMYFINLIAGAPARASLMNPGIRSRIVIKDMVARFESKTRTTSNLIETQVDKQQKKGKEETESFNIEKWIHNMENKLSKVKAKLVSKGAGLEQLQILEKQLADIKRRNQRETFDLTLSQRPVSITAAIAGLIIFIADLITTKFVA